MVNRAEAKERSWIQTLKQICRAVVRPILTDTPLCPWPWASSRILSSSAWDPAGPDSPACLSPPLWPLLSPNHLLCDFPWDLVHPKQPIPRLIKEQAVPIKHWIISRCADDPCAKPPVAVACVNNLNMRLSSSSFGAIIMHHFRFFCLLYPGWVTNIRVEGERRNFPSSCPC